MLCVVYMLDLILSKFIQTFQPVFWHFGGAGLAFYYLARCLYKMVTQKQERTCVVNWSYVFESSWKSEVFLEDTCFPLYVRNMCWVTILFKYHAAQFYTHFKNFRVVTETKYFFLLEVFFSFVYNIKMILADVQYPKDVHHHN